MTLDFLVLDAQSLEDRTVVVIERGREWVQQQEEEDNDRGDLRVHDRNYMAEEGMSVWKKYRVPFEKAWPVQCGIEGFCSTDLAEEYFVGVVERESGIEDDNE